MITTSVCPPAQVRHAGLSRSQPAVQTAATSYVGFTSYASRWLALLDRARGTSVTHFAYRMDDFALPDTGASPLAALCEAAGDTRVTVVLSPHALGLLNRPVARRLQAAGAHVLWSPARGLGSMHVKATVFGSPGAEKVMLGSADLWSARLDRRPGHWRRNVESHEFGLEVRGDMARDVHQELQRIVDESTFTPRVKLGPRPAGYAPSEARHVILTGFPPGSQATFSLEARLCEEVRRARRSVYIEDQYFSLVHPADRWSSDLLDALADAVDRGVAVTVVLPSRNWQSGLKSIMGLGTAGTVAHLFDRFGARHERFMIAERTGAKAPVHSHSKVMVIDERLLVTGSANLCRRSLSYDFELTAFVDDEQVARSSLGGLLPDLSSRIRSGAAGTPRLFAESRHLRRLVDVPTVRPSRLRTWLLTNIVDPGERPVPPRPAHPAATDM